jgi:hypothetical protein
MPTKTAARRQRPVPEYGSFNSYPLNQEQIKRALRPFEFDLLEDSGTDEKAGCLLALLRSFTYTTDSAQRENMLVAAEVALMPYVGATSDALRRLSIQAHKSLTGGRGPHGLES